MSFSQKRAMPAMPVPGGHSAGAQHVSLQATVHKLTELGQKMRAPGCKSFDMASACSSSKQNARYLVDQVHSLEMSPVVQHPCNAPRSTSVSVRRLLYHFSSCC